MAGETVRGSEASVKRLLMRPSLRELWKRGVRSRVATFCGGMSRRAQPQLRTGCEWLACGCQFLATFNSRKVGVGEASWAWERPRCVMMTMHHAL